MDSYYRQYIDAADAIRKRGEPVPQYREWLEGQLVIAHSLLEDARREIDDRESALALYRAVHLPSAVNVDQETIDKIGRWQPQRSTVEADSYRNTRYNMNVDPNGE